MNVVSFNDACNLLSTSKHPEIMLLREFIDSQQKEQAEQIEALENQVRNIGDREYDHGYEEGHEEGLKEGKDSVSNSNEERHKKLSLEVRELRKENKSVLKDRIEHLKVTQQHQSTMIIKRDEQAEKDKHQIQALRDGNNKRSHAFYQDMQKLRLALTYERKSKYRILNNGNSNPVSEKEISRINARWMTYKDGKEIR